MKRGYIRLLIVNILLLAVATANCFLGMFNNYSFILFLFAFGFGLFFFIGFEKDRQRYKKDIMLSVVIYSVLYILITYIAGLLIGFSSICYSLTLINILKNTIPVIILIFLAEIIRYMIVIKGSKYKPVLVFTFIVFVLLDITMLVPAWDLHIRAKLVDFIITVIFPSMAKNVLLMYLTFKVGYKSAVLYRLIFEIPVYFLPISPDFGFYIDSLLQILIPASVTYFIYRSFEKTKNKEIFSRPKVSLISKISSSFVSVVLLVVVILVSGYFKYFALVVGSMSMDPTITKGDAVIVQKINDSEINNLQEGDVLIFKHNEKMIIHRISGITHMTGEKYFHTKGDNNKHDDDFVVTKVNIIGLALVKIPYIGWPAVLLSEVLNK